MKKLSILVTILIMTITTNAQTWKLDRAHSKLGFTVTHLMISDVDGLFKDFDTSIKSSKTDFSDAIFMLTAKTNSIFTDNDQRDAHLKSADFFDAEKYPELKFKSKTITKNGSNKFKVSGDLEMHGITKTVTLDVILKGQTTNPMSKKPVVAFNVTGSIKRSDFKIGAGTPTAMVGDEVKIIANGEFTTE